MRTIRAAEITPHVKRMFVEENYELGKDFLHALGNAKKQETSPVAVHVIERIEENARIAREDKYPICQDTGFAVVFAEVGQDLHIEGSLYDAVNDGIRQACKDGFLRASILTNPVKRDINSGDNTPAVVHVELVPGDKLTLHVLAKGGGSENGSKMYMLKPNDGLEGVRKAVVETVVNAGPNACPPFIIGVGVGGTFDKAAILAKKALLREIGSRHPDPEVAAIEEELLTRINNLGIGPQGLGGKTTALSVFVNLHPCHIASLPVVVNTQCIAQRHRTVVI